MPIESRKVQMPAAAWAALGGIGEAIGTALGPSSPEPGVLRDEVIVGLRERGWPEPRPYSTPIRKGVGWGEFFPHVWLEHSCRCAGYMAEDALESATLSFCSEGSASRIIEAIDRLRWVIGLPPRELPPLYRLDSDGRISVVSEPGVKYSDADFQCALHLLGRGADAAAGLVPLPPSKPEPKPDPPYEPRKWGDEL